jgi:hypothetical protein
MEKKKMKKKSTCKCIYINGPMIINYVKVRDCWNRWSYLMKIKNRSHNCAIEYFFFHL